ncbi:HEPN domain-containing protein [Parapedobacter sp. DT-150]|uniref:HEPN domain-containing protein n=1 Tax=Parapedobacter sp. DT-150 TaxID=3396162 RepID=UPI003F1BB390
MKREEFKLIAKLRIDEAKTLLANGHYSGAYYLAGYALECGVKACLAKQISEHNIPEKKFINDIYTHDLQKLIKFDDDLNTSYETLKSDGEFIMNWTIVKDWNEQSRYKKYDKNQAEELINAILSKNKGILSWVQQYW